MLNTVTKPTFSSGSLFCLQGQNLTCFSQSEANKIKKEAEDLDRLIDQKLKDYEDLREDMRGKELEVKKLLEKGKTEQQVGLISRWLHLLRPALELCQRELCL